MKRKNLILAILVAFIFGVVLSVLITGANAIERSEQTITHIDAVLEQYNNNN